MTAIKLNSDGSVNKAFLFGGLVVLGLCGYGTYKLFFAKDKKQKEQEKEEKDQKQQTSDNAENAKKVSQGRILNDTEAKDYAERLYLSMKDVGTDESMIRKLLIEKDLRSGDYIAIYDAFGRKKYGTYGSPMFDWMGGDNLDLREWLYREVSGSLYEQIEKCFKQAGLGYLKK